MMKGFVSSQWDHFQVVQDSFCIENFLTNESLENVWHIVKLCWVIQVCTCFRGQPCIIWKLCTLSLIMKWKRDLAVGKHLITHWYIFHRTYIKIGKFCFSEGMCIITSSERESQKCECLFTMLIVKGFNGMVLSTQAGRIDWSNISRNNIFIHAHITNLSTEILVLGCIWYSISCLNIHEL